MIDVKTIVKIDIELARVYTSIDDRLGYVLAHDILDMGNPARVNTSQ